MSTRPDSVGKIGKAGDLDDILKKNKLVALLTYAKPDKASSKEYFEYFYELSKEFPEIKFYLAKKREIGFIGNYFDISFSDLKELRQESQKSTFDVESRERAEMSICGRRPCITMEDPRMFHLFKEGKKFYTVDKNKAGLKSALCRLSGKEVPPMEGVIEKFEDYETAIRSNKAIALRFQRTDSESFDCVSKEEMFKDVQFLRVNMDSEDSNKFLKVVKDKNLFVDWTYFVTGGEFSDKSARYNATKRKITKKLCKVLGKDIPALPPKFYLTQKEEEELAKSNQYFVSFVLKKEEDIKNFEYLENDYPEVKFGYVVYGDFKSDQKNLSFLGGEVDLPYFTLFKDGEFIRSVNEPEEYKIRFAFSFYFNQPKKSSKGFPATMEEINDIIKNNKQVIVSSFKDRPVNKFDHLIKKMAPEAILIKVNYKDLPEYVETYQKQKGKKFLFFKDGKEITRIDENKKQRTQEFLYGYIDFCTERVMIKAISKLLGQKPPKLENPEEIDDLDEFKNIIASNKIVFAHFRGDNDTGFLQYNEVKETEGLQDLKTIKVDVRNTPEFEGNPLVPSESYGFVIYVEGKIFKEYDFYAKASKIVKVIGEQMGVDLRKGYTCEEDAEKIIKENEYVAIFQINYDEMGHWKGLYNKVKTDPKYSKLKVIKMDDECFSEERIGNISKVLIRNQCVTSDDLFHLFKNGNAYCTSGMDFEFEEIADYLLNGKEKGIIDNSKTLNEIISKGDKVLIYYYDVLNEEERRGRGRHIEGYLLGDTIENIKKECGDKIKHYYIPLRFFGFMAEEAELEMMPSILFFEGGKEVKRMERPDLKDFFEEAKKFAA